MKKFLFFLLIILSLPAFSQLSVTNETGCPVDIMINGKQIAFLQATDALGRPYTATVSLTCATTSFDARYLDKGIVKFSTVQKSAGSCSVTLAKSSSGVYNKSYSPSVSVSSSSSGSASTPNFLAYVGLVNKSQKYVWIEKSSDNGPFAGVCLKPMDTCKIIIGRDAAGKPKFEVYKADWEQGYHQMSMRFSATADIRDAQPQSTLQRYVAQGDEYIIILDSDYPESTLGEGTGPTNTKARFVINNKSDVELVGKTGSLDKVVFAPGVAFDKILTAKTGKQDFAFDFSMNGLARTITMNAVLHRGRIVITITNEDLKKNFIHK